MGKKEIDLLQNEWPVGTRKSLAGLARELTSDKLLYKHYSNRPWAHLFEAQKEYRQLLQPMFDEVPDSLAIHDPLTKSNR